DNYGIYMYGSTLSLAGTTITGNTAAVGIYSDASQIELLSTNSIADGIQTQRSTTTVAAQSSSQISRFIDFTVPYGGDNPDGLFGLVVDEQLRQRGSLALSNTSGSLKNASPGDQFPLYVAQSQPYGFSSFITPVMPPGLGLVLVDAPPVRGDPTGAVAEVIAIETPEFDDPFSGTVDSPPVDLIALDADGDGDEDVAVLFDGTPGAVAAFDITESSEPVLIPSLVAQVGMAPILMDAADLDGDGDSDLLIANSGDNSITLLMLQGDGTFASTTIPATGGQITCAAAIDWDGDAYLDVVTGIDVAGPTSKDRFQIILDVADSPQTGPVFDIDLAGGQPDAPLTLTGGMAQDSWGFAGGTTFGRVLHANQATGVLALLGEQQGRVNRVIGKDIDDDGGDGQVDIIACSETAGELYIIPGNTGGFDEPIPLLTSLATTDFVVLDADRDGDEDFILASPTDPFEPLILLRNGGATRSRSMGGRTWGKQGLNGDGSPTRLTSGKLDPKDEQDDWVLGSGAATRRGGSQEGKIAQLTLSDFSCEGDVNQDGTVDLEDLLAVLDAWESQDPEMDVDGDGVITIDDILLLISIWGDCTT
ncbi:MAG: FG-GAP-like repeat-containing protein, partial [Phycisphaerales bacterium]|nr:FG-GAP-like repeat-containing protein [Phycisphaerales bacterium]